MDFQNSRLGTFIESYHLEACQYPSREPNFSRENEQEGGGQKICRMRRSSAVEFRLLPVLVADMSHTTVTTLGPT